MILKKLFLSILVLFLSIQVRTALGRLPELIYSDFQSGVVKIDGHIFFLNGQGTHTVSIFKIKVYKVFLFLERLSKNAQEVIESPERKIIYLKFLRDIEADQLRSAFLKGFHENCASHCREFEIYLNQINSQIPNFKEGDSLEFQFYPSKVLLRSNLGNYSEVNDPTFGKVLLAIWLGSNPPSSDLKSEILGLSY